MGIVSKLYTFVGGTTKTGEAAQVNADFDTLYTLVNGGLDDANVSALANIQQSKIATLITDLAARTLKAGDTMTGALLLKFAFPYLRLIGTDASNRDWRITTSGFGGNAGAMFFSRNDGAELAPVWTDLYRLSITGTPAIDSDLATKLYTDSLIAGKTTNLAFAKIFLTNGNVTFSPVGTFGEVSALSAGLTVQDNHHVRATVICNVSSDAVSDDAVYVSLGIDGVNSGGLNGLVTVYSLNNQPGNASFSFISDPLSAGAHNFAVWMRSVSGNCTIHMNTSHPAFLFVEEMVTSN